MIYTGATDSLRDLDKIVRQTTADLRPYLDRFDVIAVTGMSGALVGAPVALRLKKPLAVIRKDTGDSHHGRGAIIGHAELRQSRALFLDDFVSGGTSRLRVISAALKVKGKVTAQYLYRDRRFEELTDGRWRSPTYFDATPYARFDEPALEVPF